MELYDALYNRRVTRDFKNNAVPDEVLKRIINAGLRLCMTTLEIGNL